MKFLNSILRVIFTKSFAFGVLAALQLIFLFALIWWFASAGAAAYIIITILTVLVLMVVLEKDDLNPAYKLMWTLVVILMPVFGTVFYLLWGHRTVPRRVRRKLREIDTRSRAAIVQPPGVMDALQQKSPALCQNARYLARFASSPVFYEAAGTEYYPIGEDFFPRFLDEIKKAKRFVFLQYYIMEPGVMLDTTMDILRGKVAEGVQVRVLWDGLGSMTTLPGATIRQWRSWGIQCYSFIPLRFTIHVSHYAMLNHRNHQKIAVIDGAVGFSGGLNFADEYINVKKRFGVWKDTAFLIRGEAVSSLTDTFLRAWDYAADTESDPAAWLPAADAVRQPLALPQSFVQPYWDSPLDGENVSENAYLNIIRHAKRYVYISTPYLILDHEMITNLTLAAKSGVDVRILTPGIPDKPTVFLVTQSYYPILLREGVRIYEYTPGFNHAKMYVCDDEAAIIGSANMDYRSLYLHFENCVAFYGGTIVQDAKRDMMESFAAAREITLEDTQRIPLPKRLLQTVAKFFSPML